METTKVEGVIEAVVLDKTRKGNDYVKIVVGTEGGRRTVNIFNLELYDKEKVSKGNGIAVNCFENTWTADDGTERTSLIADSIEGIPLKKSVISKKEPDENSVESIMESCLRKSYEMLKALGAKEGIEFAPEDVRTAGVAMFIESCRRHK